MADDSSPIQFSRAPYAVSFHDLHGQLQTIRRVPPPKLHDALPTDRVELTTKKSDDFREGDEVTVKYINPRHPNTLQLVNGNGDTTFVDYYDVNLVNEVAPRTDRLVSDRPSATVSNRYLMWP
jgi:hypothetical protein